jgi:diguanylate cyclase (GGDEF)-like protein
MQRLLKKTPVRGIAFYKPGVIYANDLYGEPPMLVPSSLRPNDTLSRLTTEDSRYEISFGPQTMQTDYAVVIRLDSINIQKRVLDYIRQTAMVAILLSAFVTSVLILVLGKWMIEPILILRHNLLGVARDPSSPTAYLTHYSRRDELGSVISSANKLIKQNADHLSRISQQAQDKIYKVAFFDALTELPNRVHFLKKLDEILQGEERHRYPKLGVLVMDIDHFGDVNNTLGYEAGDKLLSMIAEKLKAVLPDALLIARLSEDEFAAIINLPYEPEHEIENYVDKVLKIFDDTFVIDNNDLVLEGSSGMALWPDDADTAAGLLKKAETALDQAKLEQDGHFRLYSPSFDLAVQNRIQMINDLRYAIEEKEFSLVYQPQIRAEDGKIIGAEALLRWERKDPETGKLIFTGPDKFIPVAEQSGLIVPIGRWVMEEACRFAKECQTDGIEPFRIAVNLSGIQFHRDDVITLTRDVLTRTGLAPHLLELEVTESAVMKDINQTINLLQQLKDLGVELAIDDFGTGYSSLSYLKRFPVHRLKIDRSFVINITDNPDEATITRTIINLGHAIGLHVIAEGVETADQVKFLAENGCDEFQGYFFSKPLKPMDFKTFVKGYKPAV